MRYFINQKTGLHGAIGAGSLPDDCDEVKQPEYEAFCREVARQKEDRISARNKLKAIKNSAFNFDGVNVSVTSKDEAGLTNVLFSMERGFYDSTVFVFQNGASIKIDQDSAKELLSKVVEFRQKLFLEGVENADN